MFPFLLLDGKYKEKQAGEQTNFTPMSFVEVHELPRELIQAFEYPRNTGVEGQVYPGQMDPEK